MADSSLTSVNYGRPGLTTYDLDGREWTFSRRSSRKELKQVAEWQCASPTPTNLLSTNPSANATTSRRDAKRLTHDYPQLAPSTRQLPELNTVSEAVTSAATTYDPLLGDLLSFGTIFLDRGGRPKRIAALPAGPSGNVLRLAVLGQQRHGWGNEKSVWLSGPSIKDSDSGYWNEDAVPIQQVCFAQAEGSNSFLAVRLPGRTVLFRPLYHRGRRAAKLSPYYDLPPSVISAHSILSLAHDETGGAPHADVTFNPDYQFQFGIIDQRYMWSIWQIERRAKRDEYSVTCLVRGNLIPEDTASPDDGDGWAKILWVGDHNTVLVCNRRHASLLSIEGETFRYLPMPPLVPQRSTDWILDVKSHPRFRNHFFVLTTTSLFVVAVTTSSASIDNTADQAGATILFSRRHYRGDEDLTLRLSVQTLADAGMDMLRVVRETILTFE
jgi:RNA polymerase I-specific transcription initiation factor RRN6